MEQKYGKILHLGIVVRDVEKAVRIYERELGIGPWTIENSDDFFGDKLVNDGHGLNIRSAICRDIGYEIELIEPIGPGLYEEWLRQHGPGMHHVILDSVNSYEETVKMGERISPNSHYMDARWPDGRPIVSYINMVEEIGLMLECGPKADKQEGRPLPPGTFTEKAPVIEG